MNPSYCELIQKYSTAYLNGNLRQNYQVARLEQTTLTYGATYDIQTPVYYILIIEQNMSLTDSEREELTLLKNAFGICQRMKSKFVSHSQLMHEYLLVRLINNDVHDRAMIYARLRLLNIRLKPNLFIIAIAPCQEANMPQTQLNQHIQNFRELLAPSIATVFKNLIVALYSTDETKISDYIYTSLEKLLIKTNMQAGISGSYTDVSLTCRYYRQALDTVANGQLISPRQSIYLWNDYIMYRFLTKNTNYTTLDDFIMDSVKELIEYDRQNNTEFLKTLHYYVVNVCNATKTAQALCIHRNTLIYRIKKIEEIMNIDFTDGNVLLNIMISFKALELLAIGNKRKICFFMDNDNTQL